MKIFEIKNVEPADPATYLSKYWNDPEKLKQGEHILAQDPEAACTYACYKLNGPFPAGEKAIATDPFLAKKYAILALKHRFQKAERVIATDKNAKTDYESYFKIKLPTPKDVQQKQKKTEQKLRLSPKKMFWLKHARENIGELEPWGDTIEFDELPKGTVQLYDVYSNPEDVAASDEYNEFPELTIYKTPDGKLYFYDHYENDFMNPDQRQVTELLVNQKDFEKGLVPFSGSFREFMTAWLHNKPKRTH